MVLGNFDFANRGKVSLQSRRSLQLNVLDAQIAQLSDKVNFCRQNNESMKCSKFEKSLLKLQKQRKRFDEI